MTVRTRRDDLDPLDPSGGAAAIMDARPLAADIHRIGYAGCNTHYRGRLDTAQAR